MYKKRLLVLLNLLLVVTMALGSIMLTGCEGAIGFASDEKGDIPDGRTSEKVYSIVEENELPANVKEVISALKSDRGYFIFKEQEGYDENALVMISLGEKRTAGYDISIEASIEEQNNLLVLIDEIKPNEDEMVSQVITFPYVVIEVEDKYDNYNVRSIYEEEFKNLAEIEVKDPEVEYVGDIEPIPVTDPRKGESFIEGEITNIDKEKRQVTIDVHLDTHTPDIDPTITILDNALIRRYEDNKEEGMAFDDLEEGMIIALILDKNNEGRAIINHVF